MKTFITSLTAFFFVFSLSVYSHEEPNLEQKNDRETFLIHQKERLEQNITHDIWLKYAALETAVMSGVAAYAFSRPFRTVGLMAAGISSLCVIYSSYHQKTQEERLQKTKEELEQARSKDMALSELSKANTSTSS